MAALAEGEALHVLCVPLSTMGSMCVEKRNKNGEWRGKPGIREAVIIQCPQ